MSSSSSSTTSILPHAQISPYPASHRAHSNTDWLISDRSFNHPDYYSPTFAHFGPIRILNEDRVAPKSGFPTHPHRDAEILSYILRGELTHRDSTSSAQGPNQGSDDDDDDDKKLFSRMKHGDVQFTSAGTGAAHSETNEHASEWVHFLQIWVLPWTKGLTLRYYMGSFLDEEKRRAFVAIIGPSRGV
jgi:quercetin 2,3-dioxygenase